MKHQPLNADKRIRGTTLANLRKRWFSEHPLCVECEKQGRVSLASELDHIVPLHKGGKNEDSNYQGLCEGCHKRKTADDMGYTYIERRQIGADGWPIE